MLERESPNTAYKYRCNSISDSIVAVLNSLWDTPRGDDPCPMVVMEGGTILGIANDFFHTHLEKIANKRGCNVLLSYLPAGISRWTCSQRKHESQLFLSTDKSFITVDDIQADLRLPRVTGGSRILREKFHDELQQDLTLRDWNRVFGVNRSQ
jgi:hypothetical protein